MRRTEEELKKQLQKMYPDATEFKVIGFFDYDVGCNPCMDAMYILDSDGKEAIAAQWVIDEIGDDYDQADWLHDEYLYDLDIDWYEYFGGKGGGYTMKLKSIQHVKELAYNAGFRAGMMEMKIDLEDDIETLTKWYEIAENIKPKLEELYELLGTVNKSNSGEIFQQAYSVYDKLVDMGANWDNFYKVQDSIERLSGQKYYDAIGDDASILSSVIDWKSQVSDIAGIGIVGSKLKKSNEYADLRRNIEDLSKVETVINSIIEASSAV